MELITKLGIDWKLIAAQIVNFAILFWVLKRFAFKPLLELLENRRTMIAKSVEDSQKAEKLLMDIEKTRMEAIEKIKMQSLEMTEKASKQAEAVKQEILQSGKKEVELIFHQAKAQIELEKQKMLKDVEHEVARLIVMGAAKILEKEFSDADQKRLMESAVSSFRK